MRKSTIARIALNIPENAAQFCSYGQHKIQCFTGNKDLSNPNPTIAQVTTDFGALTAADVDATNMVPGALELRQQCFETCQNDMERWAVFARTVALQNPARGPQILQSSGFDEKKPTTRRKGDVEVIFPSPGTAHVFIKAVRRGASYEWQICWTAAPLSWRRAPRRAPISSSTTSRRARSTSSSGGRRSGARRRAGASAPASCRRRRRARLPLITTIVRDRAGRRHPTAPHPPHHGPRKRRGGRGDATRARSRASSRARPCRPLPCPSRRCRSSSPRRRRRRSTCAP